MLVNGINSDVQKVNFKSIQKTKSNQGFESYDFALPYDDTKYNAYVEIVRVTKDKEGEWHPDENFEPINLPMQEGKEQIQRVSFNPAKKFLEDQSFAYRYKLVEKNPEKGKTAKVLYQADNGLKIGKEDSDNVPYIIQHRNRVPGKATGVMTHIVVDNYNPGCKLVNGKLTPQHKEREKMMSSPKNHFGLYGGDIPGMTQRIIENKKMGITRHLSTPLYGKDEISNHGYWTTNPYQIADRFGTRQDYKNYVVTLARNGMTHVADGAFVNEGLEGFHLRYNLKWGEKSPYKHWIKGSGYKTLGILPNIDTATKEGKEEFSHFKIHVVNGDKTYRYAKNSLDIDSASRDKSQRTYIQIYDDRLASPEQLTKNELIRKYDNLQTDNHYEITTHNHSVLPIAIPIEEDELPAFYARMKENKAKYENRENADFIMSVLKFQNFQVGVKGPGNFNTWDGNVDVAKLNYTYTNKDELDLTLQGASEDDKQAYESATFQVQDYIQKTGSYWTRDYRNIAVEDFARTIGSISGDNATADNYKKIIKSESKNNLPDTAERMVPSDVIDNVIKGDYYIPQLADTSIPKQRLAEDIMAFPLEAIEFSDDLTAVLGSPMISKRAHTQKDVNKTRNEFYRANDYNDIPDEYRELYFHVDELYVNQITGLASKAIDKADQEGKMGLFKEDKTLSDKGKLVFPLISDDITKFLFVKALAPQVKVTNENGELKFDREALRKVNLRNINGGKGISARTPEEEANQVFGLIKKGMENMSDDDLKVLSDNIQQRFKGVDANDLKMAYVVADRTEVGLHWRTDATKDVVEIDNVRNGVDQLGTEWEKSIAIWKGFIQGVRKENPNAIVITEMTDMEDPQLAKKPVGRFKDELHISNKFVEETGATTTSNYTYYFNNILKMFSRDSENGRLGPDVGDVDWLVNKVKMDMNGEDDWAPDGVKGFNQGMLYNTSADGSKHAHNFIGNHDKPRAMHLYTLDMGIFHDHADAKADVEAAELKYAPKARDNKIKADRKALAMGKLVYENLEQAVNDSEFIQDKAAAKKALLEGTQDLVVGNFNGKKFNPEDFGTIDPELAIKDVIKQSASKGLKLTGEQSEKLAYTTFEMATREGRKKSNASDRLLMVLPGDPTFYAGDELVMGGYETACKNIHVKNRSIIPWEKVEKTESKEPDFIREFYEDKRKIWNMRKDPELSALSNGDTTILQAANISKDGNNEDSDIKGDYQVLAMLRHDEDSQVLVLAHDKNVERVRKSSTVESAKPEFVVHDNENDDFNQDRLEIDCVNLAEMKNDKRGRVVAGLAGGLALGTFFKDAVGKDKDSVYGVCESTIQGVVKTVVRRFVPTKEADKEISAEQNYMRYLKDPKSVTPEKIKLTDNVMVLKKAAKRLPFKGGMNQNQIKIQAYLNSKSYLGQEARYTSLKKA